MSNDTVQQRINQYGGIALTAPIADAALKGPEQKPILPVEVGHGLTSSQCHYPTLRRDFEEAADKQMQKLRRAVIEASEPFVQMKVDLLNRALPKMTITPGRGMPEIEYSAEIQAKLEEIEVLRLETVAHVMRRLTRANLWAQACSETNPL